MPKKILPITEDLDFQYLLALMQPLHNVDEFAWLPELFAIIGHESLLKLCQYAGGELIRIPTMEQLSTSINSLQLFYDVYIKHINIEIPAELLGSVNKIREVYDARNNT